MYAKTINVYDAKFMLQFVALIFNESISLLSEPSRLPLNNIKIVDNKKGNVKVYSLQGLILLLRYSATAFYVCVIAWLCVALEDSFVLLSGEREAEVEAPLESRRGNSWILLGRFDDKLRFSLRKFCEGRELTLNDFLF